KISKEDFFKTFDNELVKWMKHYLELIKSGLRGELHYEAPEFEEETIAKFTLETVMEKWREDISKEREEACRRYEEAKPEVARIQLGKVPDHASWLANKLVRQTERQLLDEAKTKAKEKIRPVEYVEVHFLKEVPAVVGADMKTYGPFKPSDIARLPKPNADALVRQGAATYELHPPRVLAPSARELALLRAAERAIKELERI
ncbi:MAG: hypothetical protein QXO01_07340, partial [Nitrososphaerota archaeon]